MKSRLGKKWLAVGVIWGVVLAMTGWNIHLINQVHSRRQELVNLEMDMGFLKANQTGIQEVRRHRSRLSHPVKSFGLGFMVVENDLKRLSWNFGLVQMQMEADINSQDTPVPVKILATGPVPALVAWMAAVEEAYPYLVTERLDLSFDNRNRLGQLQATINYHYALAEPERTG